jgi:hypothetical protein
MTLIDMYCIEIEQQRPCCAQTGQVEVVDKRTLDQLYLEFAFILGLLNVPKSPDFYVMYHLLKGLHAHLTRKDEYSVVIIGLDNVSPDT